MSAESVGMHMPAVVTLDDLAAMNAADVAGHRYETSPEGVLSVMPPPDSEHAMIASRILAWLIMAGWPAEQLLQAVGVRIPGPQGDGGRIPDLSVWRNRRLAVCGWRWLTSCSSSRPFRRDRRPWTP